MFLSVALCTYNGEKYLSEQLLSILNQSQQVNEIIICDDVSSDGTWEILHNFLNLNPEKIKLYRNNSSLGAIANFEKAISICSGDLIFLSDQDDIWKPDKVEKTKSFFKKNPGCKLFFSNGALIDKIGQNMNSTLWGKWGFTKEKQMRWKNNSNAFLDLLKNDNKITGATICMHRDLKKKALPIRVPFGFWHDAWFGIHASANNQLYFIDECLIEYRIHSEQQVGLSNKVGKDVISNSNRNPVDIKEFLKNLRNFYPDKKNVINMKGNRKSLKHKIKSLINWFGS